MISFLDLYKVNRFPNVKKTADWGAYITLFFCFFFSTATYAALDISTSHHEPIGQKTAYLVENDRELPIDAVRQKFQHSGIQSSREILNFGINSKPVWLLFSVENATHKSLSRFIRVETSWLDKIELYFFVNGELIEEQVRGDQFLFNSRIVSDRFFVFPHEFGAGQTDVYMRVNTPDPLNIPIYLLSGEELSSKTVSHGYIYGLIYGFLLALLVYNALLAFSLKSRRYLYYSQYLFFFLLMNLSYTGHGYQWIWSEQVTWQLWLNPILMLMYVVTGLLFATKFLDTRKKAYRLHRVINLSCSALVLSAALCILFTDNVMLLYLAFCSVIPFSALMIFSGVLGMVKGMKEARYFFVATIFATCGAVCTAFTVSGVIEYSNIGFHAVEIGMLIEAVLFALALSYQFKIIQEGKLEAERLADIDPLTGLYNRRGFYKILTPLFSAALRKERALSLLILDVDYFKQINDLYGHTRGDDVLRRLSNLLLEEARSCDLVGRWGGEEFIILLPETNKAEAVILAQRIVDKVSELKIAMPNREISFTVSIGVSCLENSNQPFNVLLEMADDALFIAKSKGRNRVALASS